MVGWGGGSACSCCTKAALSEFHANSTRTSQILAKQSGPCQGPRISDTTAIGTQYNTSLRSGMQHGHIRFQEQFCSHFCGQKRIALAAAILEQGCKGHSRCCLLALISAPLLGMHAPSLAVWHATPCMHTGLMQGQPTWPPCPCLHGRGCRSVHSNSQGSKPPYPPQLLYQA